MTTASAFRLIPIEEIHESKHNPRRHFDGPALEQLADSIRKVGVLTPALVRPNAKGFELAAGHRRYRASQLAGLTQLPCLVREMDDQTFMEALTIENLQREDVHPLDEAKGYEALMAPPYKMDVQKIADRVGKSTKYIYDCRKLLDLTEAAQELFWDGRIKTGQAILLARLTADEQKKVIGTKEDDYQDGGLFEGEQRLYDTEEEDDADTSPRVKVRSRREVEAWIKRHIRFNAKQADTFLFPDTVAKVAEATRAKIKLIEITREYLATDDVRHAGTARIYGERAWKRADGHEDSKTCDRSVMGVIVSGAGQGQAFFVCINKDKCLVHWGEEIRAREKNRKLAEKAAGGDVAAKTSLAERERKQREARAAEEKREEEERQQWKKAVPTILSAIAERVRKLPTKAKGFLGQTVIREMARRHGTSSHKLNLPGSDADAVVRQAAYMILAGEADNPYWGRKNFPPMAKGLGIDLDKILKASPKPAAAEPAPKKKPVSKAPVQTSAPKGKKKQKAA